jgi:hypothetical protein
VGSHIAQLRVAIDREASVADRTLGEQPSTLEGGYTVWGEAEHSELRRQLGALRERATDAASRIHDAPTLTRVDLATLLSFAKTLRSDAEAWRAGFDERLAEIAREQAVARRERERVTAERAALLRQRDALQSLIDDMAEQMARDLAGEHRRTVPFCALATTVTVCSQRVVCPKRGLRLEKRWLVTLDDSRDRVLVRRCYV